MLNRALIGIGGGLAILGIPAYYYIRSQHNKQQLQKQHLNKDPSVLSRIQLSQIPDLQLTEKNYVCQLYPMINSKLHGVIRINNNRLKSFDLSDMLPSGQTLFLSVYQFGDLTAGRKSLGRKIMTLGQLSDNPQGFGQEIRKQIVGRSLVIQNEGRQIFAAGIVALE